MTNYRTLPDDGRLRWLSVAVALCFGFCVRPAAAQAPVGNQFGAQSVRRPTTSSYLNLQRTGDPTIDFAINYQQLVRPQRQFRNDTANLNNRLNSLQRQVNRAIRPDGTLILPGTGHATSFMNTGQYFPGYRGR